MANVFASGEDFGSNANCIGRLEVLLPSLLLMLDNGQVIHESLMVPIYEDSAIFYDGDDENGDAKYSLSNLTDESLLSRAEKILPGLKRLLDSEG